MPCESPGAALAVVQSLPVVMAILDFEMPGQNGAQLASALRAVRPTLPILLVSGNSTLTEEDLRHFDAVCPKGTSPLALFRKIADLLKSGNDVSHPIAQELQ